MDTVRIICVVVLIACGLVWVFARRAVRKDDEGKTPLLLPLPLAEQERIRAIAATRRAEALKLVRGQLPIGRDEAKVLLDRICGGQSLPTTWAQTAEAVDPAVRAEVGRLTVAGRRVEAVKVLRQSVRVGLSAGLRVVDALSVGAGGQASRAAGSVDE